MTSQARRSAPPGVRRAASKPGILASLLLLYVARPVDAVLRKIGLL